MFQNYRLDRRGSVECKHDIAERRGKRGEGKGEKRGKEKGRERSNPSGTNILATALAEIKRTSAEKWCYYLANTTDLGLLR